MNERANPPNKRLFWRSARDRSRTTMASAVRSALTIVLRAK
jgi:hypothetical protein